MDLFINAYLQLKYLYHKYLWLKASEFIEFLKKYDIFFFEISIWPEVVVGFRHLIHLLEALFPSLVSVHGAYLLLVGWDLICCLLYVAALFCLLFRRTLTLALECRRIGCCVLRPVYFLPRESELPGWQGAFLPWLIIISCCFLMKGRRWGPRPRPAAARWPMPPCKRRQDGRPSGAKASAWPPARPPPGTEALPARLPGCRDTHTAPIIDQATWKKKEKKGKKKQKKKPAD